MADERDPANQFGFVPWVPPIKPAEPEEAKARRELASMVATNAFYKMWRGGDYHSKEEMEAAKAKLVAATAPKPPPPAPPPAASAEDLREEIRLLNEKIEIAERKRGIVREPTVNPEARAAQEKADMRKDLIDRALKKASDEREQRQRRKLGRRLSKMFGV